MYPSIGYTVGQAACLPLRVRLRLFLTRRYVYSILLPVLLLAGISTRLYAADPGESQFGTFSNHYGDINSIGPNNDTVIDEIISRFDGACRRFCDDVGYCRDCNFPYSRRLIV